MTAPSQQLPPVEAISKLPKLSQIAYAIRCVLRAEPLYSEKDPDLHRARFVRACIETAARYFETGDFENKAELVDYDSRSKDYGVQAACYLLYAAEDAFRQDHDPEYDFEEAEDDEATAAHRVECVASFSLAAAYDTGGPLEESRHCERLALAATLADFKWLTENQSSFQLKDIGSLWQNLIMANYDSRLNKHAAILAAD